MPKTKKTPDMNFRGLALAKPEAGAGASTWDREARTVKLTLATELPVEIYDWEHGRVAEVLLMKGCLLPRGAQLPLLDSHDSYTVQSVLGSIRDLKIVGGELVGTAHLSSVPAAEDVATKIEEGHLTDLSVGYRRHDKTFVPKGEKAVIGGRSWTGPVLVVTSWSPREGSVCPIGADQAAKMRAEAFDELPAIPPTDERNDEMNKKIREILIRAGMKADATDEEAARFFGELMDAKRAELDKLTTEERAELADEKTRQGARDDALARAGIVEREERARCDEIFSLGKRYNLEDLATKLVRDGTDLAAARGAFLEAVHARGLAAGGLHVSVGIEDREKFGRAVADGLLVRGGLVLPDGKNTPYGVEFAGRSLVEIARHALRMAGKSDGGEPMMMLGRALTASDLPSILADVANKSLLIGFEESDETYMVWCDDTGSLPDFKPATLASIGDTPDLETVPESGEMKYGSLGDDKESAQLAAFGKLLGISRVALINDDLGVLTDIPKGFGESARRKLGDLAYAVLTANGAMNDGKALFHADHTNLAGAGAAPDATTLGAGVAAMKLQTRLGGLSKTNHKPRYFIAPVALESKCEAFFAANTIPVVVTVAAGEAAVGQGNANIYAGGYFTRAYDARLDAASATAWYLAGAKGRTVKLFFLNGNKTPRLETRNGWAIDGAEFKVGLDAAGKAVSHRYVYKNPGA